MNVIHFFIEIGQKAKFGDSENSPIKDGVITDFKNDSSDAENYLQNAKANWNQLEPNLKTLYRDQDIVAWQNKEGIDYYLFNSSQSSNTSRDAATFELLILSNKENINRSVYVVIGGIRAILKNKKLKVLKDNFLFLFPYDESKSDIYGSSHKIKVEFKRKRLNNGEMGRLIVVLFVSVILSTLHGLGNVNVNLIPIFVSVYASGYLFFISELTLKFSSSIKIPFMKEKFQISIEDLSDCIRPHSRDFFSDEAEIPLQSPKEEELS